MNATGYIERQGFERQVQVRVARGAEWLDSRLEWDWRRLVDIDSFDMQSPCRCVLGQVFGDYWEALVVNVPGNKDDLSDGWAVDHGFNLSDGDEDSEESWDVLERTWVNYIRDTRGRRDG